MSEARKLIGEHGIELVVNCLGVLQDGPGNDTRAVHRDFVARLLQAIRDSRRVIRLIHISIPGVADDDRTAFSQTKREAERLIAASGIPYAILRPGFVIAPSAYGGSAILRALAAFPIDLPKAESATPFQPVAVEDIAATIAWLAGHDPADKIADAVTWDLMQPQPVTLDGVIEQFRRSFGTADMPRMRTTAITELRRGVTGDPHPWMAATGIVPSTLVHAVGQRSATIQDKWFARLFLIK